MGYAAAGEGTMSIERTFDCKIIPNAGRDELVEADGVFRIYLRAPAVDGKANQALIKFLAGHFNLKRSQIEIIKGLKSRLKTIKINA